MRKTSSGVGRPAASTVVAPHRHRKGHGVAQPVGKEHLGHGIDDVILGHAQHIAREAFGSGLQAGMDVPHPLGRAGGPGRIKPEGQFIGAGLDRFDLGRILAKGLIAFGALGRIADDQNGAQIAVVLHDGRDRFPQRFRHHEDRGAAVGEDALVDLRRQQRVERHRNGPGLERAPEDHGKLDLILHDHGDALLAPDAVALQRAAETGGFLRQLAIGQAAFRTVGLAKGHLVGTALPRCGGRRNRLRHCRSFLGPPPVTGRGARACPAYLPVNSIAPCGSR